VTLVRTTGSIASLGVIFGCADMSETQKGTATGAGVGAAVGGLFGAAIAGGNTGRSAVTGAAVGTAGGYVWSKMQEQRRAMEQSSQGPASRFRKPPPTVSVSAFPQMPGSMLDARNSNPRCAPC